MMPALVGKPADSYKRLCDGWVWWLDDTETKAQGWKLHIGGTKDNAAAILALALPVLQKLKIPHKFLPKSEDLDTQTGEQAGKWFAAYPDSIWQAFLAVGGLDYKLWGCDHDNTITIPNDKAVGKTVVYSRYGAFIGEKIRNDHGKMVSDEKKVSYKPGWISDPWVQYKAINAPESKGERLVLPRSYCEPFPEYSTAYQ